MAKEQSAQKEAIQWEVVNPFSIGETKYELGSILPDTISEEKIQHLSSLGIIVEKK